jgi:stearoyl-CoA desaturase (delta-9 desaturase)
VNLFRKIKTDIGWLFSKEYEPESGRLAGKKGIDWLGSIPFISFHFVCFGIIWTGWSTFAVVFAVIFYVIRMFAITGFYHRFFAHRSFKTNRFFAFVFAFLGCSAMQRGQLWWAAIHRHHHMYADTEKDIHSPLVRGFPWSHIG